MVDAFADWKWGHRGSVDAFTNRKWGYSGLVDAFADWKWGHGGSGERFACSKWLRGGFGEGFAGARQSRRIGRGSRRATKARPLESFPTFVPVDQHDSPHLSKRTRGAYTVANRPFSFLKDAHSNNLRKKQSGGKRND